MSDAITFANPADYPEQYDVVVIAGVPTPGIAEVTDGSATYKWDKKKAKGSTGRTSTFQGRDLASPTVKLTLAKDYLTGVDHLSIYVQRLLPVLQDAMRDKKPQALDVYHPLLSMNGIAAVTVEEIGQLTHEGGGLWTVELKFGEFRKPKPAGGTPKGAKGTTAGGASHWLLDDDEPGTSWDYQNAEEQAAEDLAGATELMKNPQDFANV